MSFTSLSFDPVRGPRPVSVRSRPVAAAASAAAGAALPMRLEGAPTSRRRHAMLVPLVALHVVVVVGLLNLASVSEKVREQAPVFLAVLSPAPKPPVSHPLPSPSRTMPAPAPLLALPVIAPAPAAMIAAAVVDVAPPAPAAVETPAAPPAPAPAPRTLPAAAVQYLVPPAPVYSRQSARQRESGRAVVRVWIDESGMPRDVQIATSSGFQRLDESAVVAVRGARFKPYLENGVALAGWAFVPIEFELGK